jgi:hypothetical protein
MSEMPIDQESEMTADLPESRASSRGERGEPEGREPTQDAGPIVVGGHRFDTVACCSGHMIDRDDRPIPRFPPCKEPAMRAAMAGVLDEWGIGSVALAVSGGARGADILFAELCLELGAIVRLLVALPDDQFIERSVRLPGTDWEQRYLRLRERCETRHWSGSPLDPQQIGEAMDRTNQWILETARAEAAPNQFHALLVWDERPSGDGHGGTADFAARARGMGADVAILNPLLIGEGNSA